MRLKAGIRQDRVKSNSAEKGTQRAKVHGYKAKIVEKTPKMLTAAPFSLGSGITGVFLFYTLLPILSGISHLLGNEHILPPKPKENK